MAGSPRNFDVEDFNKWKRRQGSSYKMPPRANFMAAAIYIRNFFESKKLNWAIMMGLAMACLGSRREMLDIHVVYDDRDLNRIKMKLEADQRVRLQKGINSLFPAKILVATGPKFKDAGCTEDAEVEVDLVPPGAYSTPPNDVLKNSQVMLRLKHEGNSETFRGLNMLYLVKTTIAYCKSQDLAWDPKKDLLFLCQFYGREIELIRTQLNARQIQENFLGTTFVLGLSADEQRRCYHVLLGADKNPPPSMSLTPPPPPPPIGHRLTASTSDINSVRPRMASHKSSPSLNTMQQSSKYLIPPLPGRSKKDKGLSQSAPPTAASVPTPKALIVASEQSSQRDSRSRYRHSSALNSPLDIRSLTHAANPQITPRARSAERPTHPPEASLDQAKPIGSHRHHQLPDLVTKSDHAATQVPPLPIGMRPQRSMPALVARTVGPVPIFAHGVNTIASQIPKASAPQTLPQGSLVSNFASQASQGHAQRHEGLQCQNYDVPKPSDARKRPPVGAQPHLPHLPDISQFRLTADIGATSSRNASDYQSGNTCTPVSDVCAQRHIKLSAPKPSQQLQSQSQSQPQQPTLQPLSQQQDTASGFVHELDARPQHHTGAPQSELPNEFIAELPADMRSYHSENEVSLLPKISVAAESECTNIISLFAGEANAIEGTISHTRPKTMGQVPPSPPQSSEQARPLPFHTSPPVPNALPSSLMIGHGRNVSIKSTPQPISYFREFSLNVNSQKYMGAQYSNPTDIPTSAKKPTVSQYKAYSGPISPPAQPPEPVHPRQQPAFRLDNQMFRVQNRTEASPVHVLDVHQSQPQPASGACQAILSTRNLLTPPAFEPEISQQFPRYDPNSVAVTSAHTVSLADESRFATYGIPTGYTANRNRENGAFQQSDPCPPTHYSPPVALSVFTRKEPSLAQLPGSIAESGHQRSASRDSQTSTSSHESEKLAQEYQAYLPDPRSRFAEDEVGFT